MKWLSLLLMVGLMYACGGGGGPPPVVPEQLPRLNKMVVIPNNPVQYTEDGLRMEILPYRDTSAYAVNLAITTRPTWVYVYDELFWTGTSVDIGKDELGATAAAQAVQRAGLKTAISILPAVIADPGFTLKFPTAFDVIAVDIYPSFGMHPLADLRASVNRLRALGFKGEIWYIYQGPKGFPAITDDQRAEQDQAIRLAPFLGVSGLVEYNY